MISTCTSTAWLDGKETQKFILEFRPKKFLKWWLFKSPFFGVWLGQLALSAALQSKFSFYYNTAASQSFLSCKLVARILTLVFFCDKNFCLASNQKLYNIAHMYSCKMYVGWPINELLICSGIKKQLIFHNHERTKLCAWIWNYYLLLVIFDFV